MKKYWQFLVNWGEHLYQTRAEKDRNRIVNLILLYFTIVLFLLDFFTAFLYLVLLLPVDYERYINYCIAYTIPLAIVQIFVTGSYIAKNILGHNTTWSMVALFAGLAFISVYAIFLGPDSSFYFFSFMMLPLPFFMLDWQKRRALLFIEIAMAVQVVATIIWVRENPGLFAHKPEINELIALLTWVAMIFTIVLCTYYFWRETQIAEVNLRKAHSDLQEKDQYIQQELKFAADIQYSILPRGEGSWREINYHAIYQPMGKVSGDFFDIFKHEDNIYFLLADISGHGVPAALITMIAKQVFYKITSLKLEPAEIFKQANEELLLQIQTQDYLTAFLVKIDKNYRVTYANAGHTRSFYYQAKKNRYYGLDTGGIMLGAFDKGDAQFSQKQLQLEKGDQLILYTDGILEQQNEKGEEYSLNRFYALLRENKRSSIAEIHQSIMHDFHIFRGEKRISDDVTMLSMERV